MILSCMLLAKATLAQPLVMNLENIFDRADSCSKSLQISKIEMDIAQEKIRAAKSSLLPEVSVSVSASYLGDGYLWDRNFQNGQNIDMPHFGNNFALEVAQVIYAGGAIKEGIALTELSSQMSRLDWQKNRQEIRILLAGNYLDLQKLDNQLSVLEQNIKLTEMLIEKMKSKHEEGVALKNDIIRYELQLENLKLQKNHLIDAKNIINHQLVTALHLSNNTEIVPDSNFLNNEIKVLTQDEWQLHASQNNVGLLQTELLVKIYKQKENLIRSELLPQIAFVVANHLDGPITIEVPVLDNNFNYWYVGLGIQYNLSSLYKKNHKLKATKLQTMSVKKNRELAQEQIDNAIQATYTNFVTAFSDLHTQEKNVELANKNYELINNRYQNDLALLAEMLDANNVKLNAEMSLENSRISLIYNYLKLKYICGIL